MAGKKPPIYGIAETANAMILLSSRRRAGRQAAQLIYDAAMAAARRPALYLDHGVPDTLQGRFEMLALHLFPVLYRLMHMPGDDPDLAQLISERLVSETDAAFREMGVGDVTVPKRMKAFYRSFAGRIGAYKSALEAGEHAFVEAVARNVFPNGDVDGNARALTLGVQAAVAALRDADLRQLRAGDVPYPSLAPARG